MMRRTLTSKLLFALPLVVACTEGERYAAPGPDTRPTVSLDLPNIIRVSTDEAFRVSPTFAIDSTDLRFLVASNAKVGSRRVLDLSRPRHQRLLGYGTYAGRTETYRRTVMLDEYGVHSVRTAIFRANTSGEHSNVWYNHLARSLTGEIYLTQMSRWDWQDGEVNLTKVPVGAWPMMSSVTLSGYYRQSYFGLHPGIWDTKNPLRRSFITTDAVAPTSGIRDCVLYFQAAASEDDTYLAYFHEQLGLVEIIYKWEDYLHEVLPIDGFSIELDSVDEAATSLQTISSPVAGKWRGRVTPQRVVNTRTDVEETNELSSGFSIELDLDSEAFGYDERYTSYFLRGSYRDSYEPGRELYGKYYESTAVSLTGERSGGGYFELVGGANVETSSLSPNSLLLWGARDDSGALRVNYRVLRTRGDQYYAVTGAGTLEEQ